MNQLLEKNQIISAVPQNFKNSNKGKIIDIQDTNFLLEMIHNPEGFELNNFIEFYSQTNNGMLYFVSDVKEVNGNILKISIPVKHRFLQRRTFTRIKFAQDVEFRLEDKVYSLKSLDLSAGGMKLESSELLDINSEYDLSIKLLGENYIKCRYELIKIEKNKKSIYTISGRFKNLTNIDKMGIIQFCMRKSIENLNK
jgi:c-di-GMP-binding flagellar brake protein YcgR